MAGSHAVTLAIVIPMLDEEAALPALVEALGRLVPKPAEVIAVDGGSKDSSIAIAREAGWRVIECEAGRGRQINAGVAAATADQICVLHADTIPPRDMVRLIAETLADKTVALGGFTPVIAGARGVRWGTTAHNFLKTWYAPLLFRPRLFFRGARLLFGDHAMFFRRADFLRVGGCDTSMKIMEDADLCVRMAPLGRTRLLRRTVRTSDRRIAEWGALKANWIYFKVGIAWGLGMRDGLEESYPDVR